MSFASIVPLIGGETIAMENVFGEKPKYILSYKDFEENDKQLLNYYNNSVRYVLLDQDNHKPDRVDVVNTVCPCAGLSSLSVTSSADNSTNDWMVKSARYVLEEIQPRVFWGENAPRLAGSMGKPIVASLQQLARKNGYTLSLYKTKSILHGLSQVRERTFYFFWKGNKTPIFNYYKREHTKIEDQILSSARNDEDPMSDILVTEGKPVEVDPYYEFILSVIHPGMSHFDFVNSIEKSVCSMDYIERSGVKYKEVANWMRSQGKERVAEKCDRVHEKLESGGNVMRRTSIVPKDFIGAFVGHLPGMLMHPTSERFLSVRECLDIMKMPKDFELVGGRKNINMICQNVPVTTAEDMAREVQSFLAGESRVVDSEFVIQDNKSQHLYAQKDEPTLEYLLDE